MKKEILLLVQGHVRGFTLLLAACFVLAAALQVLPQSKGERFADIPKILKSVGFETGVYDPEKAMDMQLDPATESRMSRLEGDMTLDTAGEFLMAMYYSAARPGGTASPVFAEELPAGRTGALRLAAMWLFRIAEYPAEAERYRKIVRLIRSESRLDSAEIVDYFQGALKKKVQDAPLPVLSKDEAGQVRDLLLLYLMDPTNPDRVKNFRNCVKGLSDPSGQKAGAVSGFLESISPLLAGKLM